MTAGLPVQPPTRPADLAAIAWIPLMAALACAETLEARLDVKAQIKWPNDVLVSGRKIAGILGQRVLPENEAAEDIILVGMGLNWLNRLGAEADFRGFRPVAASELRPGLSADDREGFLRAWLARLARRAMGGPDAIAETRAETERRLWRKGESIALEHTEQGRVEGVLMGLGDGGSARIKMTDGRLETLHCGWPMGPAKEEK